MRRSDYADTAQARETDRQDHAACRDFFADPDALVEPAPESDERRQAHQARLHKAIAAMEMICGYRK